MQTYNDKSTDTARTYNALFTFVLFHLNLSYFILLYPRTLSYWITVKPLTIRRTAVGNKIVDNSDVVGASAVGAAPTTSSFST